MGRDWLNTQKSWEFFDIFRRRNNARATISKNLLANFIQLLNCRHLPLPTFPLPRFTTHFPSPTNPVWLNPHFHAGNTQKYSILKTATENRAPQFLDPTKNLPWYFKKMQNSDQKSRKRGCFFSLCVSSYNWSRDMILGGSIRKTMHSVGPCMKRLKGM